MSSYCYPKGLGSGYRDIFANGRIFRTTSANVKFADSETGVASGAATTKTYPDVSLATVATGALSDKVFVLGEGHSEQISALPTTGTTARSMLVGQGTGTNMSHLVWTSTAASGITLAGAYNYVENVWFGARLTNPTTTGVASVKITGATNIIRNCVFDIGDYQTGTPALLLDGADTCRLEGCTFRSVATSDSTRPYYALQVTGTINNITMIDCTFDGGTYGFKGNSDDYAASIGSAVVGGHIIGLNLLNGARLNIANSSFYGFVADDSSDHASGGIVW